MLLNWITKLKNFLNSPSLIRDLSFQSKSVEPYKRELALARVRPFYFTTSYRSTPGMSAMPVSSW